MKLLMIADDFTGALDTGIQFAKNGALTKLFIGSGWEEELFPESLTEVLILDTETRHLSPELAYETVYRIVSKAKKFAVDCIYKKTDSGLRGNIGSELEALLDASGELFLAFLPALPEMDRVTIGGIQYANGIPVAQSEFGYDPFEPVHSSKVRDLFRNQSVLTTEIPISETYHIKPECPTVGIFDSYAQSHIHRIAISLRDAGYLKIAAGCSGFAAELSRVLNFRRAQRPLPQLKRKLLVLCGSVNPITKRQIEYAEKIGYDRITMSFRQQLESGYLNSEDGIQWLNEIQQRLEKNRVVIIDTASDDIRDAQSYRARHGIALEKARSIVAERLGDVLKKLADKCCDNTWMIVGGDTLMGAVRQLQCKEIIPVCEMMPGTVLSSMQTSDGKIWVITKSGGFGDPDLFEMIVNLIGITEKKEIRQEGEEVGDISIQSTGDCTCGNEFIEENQRSQREVS